MSKSKWLVGLVVVVIVALFLLQRGGDTPPKEKPVATQQSIIIGAILPLTGSVAFLGDFVKNGMQIAVDQINSTGGIHGKSLDLSYADSSNIVKKGVAAFQQLALMNPAAIIVTMSSVTSAVAPLADDRNIPLFATMVSAKDATQGHPSMFRLFINADIDARLMAEFAAKKKKMKRVSIVAVNDDMGKSFSSVFTKTFTRLGGKVPIYEIFDKSASSFRDIAAKVAAVPTDAVYLLGYTRNLGRLAKALREQGVTKPFLSIATIAQEKVREIAGNALEDTYYTSVQFDAKAPISDKSKKFVDAYKSSFGKLPTYFSAFAYDSVLLLAEAMRSRGTSSSQVTEGLKEIKAFDGVTGTISFNKDRDAQFPMSVKSLTGNLLQ